MEQKREDMKLSRFIPVLTSEAGSCLTLTNWTEVGIDTVSYHIDSLLMKPGATFLKKLQDLKSYTGWQNTVVLNTSLPSANRDAIYTIRSRFDGSLIRISSDELSSLIIQLQPDIIILPPGFVAHHRAWQSLPPKVMPFIPANECPSTLIERNFGVYFWYNKESSFSALLHQVEQQADKPVYVAGELDSSQLAELSQRGVLYIESDKPAMDAVIGQVYSEDNIVSLLSSEMAHQHVPIDANCQCPTCKQQLTRAYLHHLLEHTPLLCQRFLIQHNVYYYQNYRSNYLQKR